jgi:Ca2+-binding EF-hand superfamily protein
LYGVACETNKQQFKAADTRGRGELELREAMLMFEKRGSVKTARELRQLVMAMDQNKNKRLSFAEWLCAHFKKSYEELDYGEKAVRRKAMEEAKKAKEEADRLAESIKQAAQQREHHASLRAAALEREAQAVRIQSSAR